MPVDPSVQFGATLVPAPGWLKLAQVAGILTPIESGQLQLANAYKYTNYALCPPGGPKQKTLHARGTNEVTFSLSGELTREASGLLNLLDPSARGAVFPVILSQYDFADSVVLGYVETASFSGDSDGAVRFSISGKAASPIVSTGVLSSPLYWHQLPAWSSGNDLVRSWTVTHQVNLAPGWDNTQYPWPAYYRPGESEYTLSVTTVAALREYAAISLSVGAIEITGVVVSAVEDFSGDDPVGYRVDATNVNIAGAAFTPGAALAGGGSPQAWPDGV